jgi:hypothetical protein
MISQRSLYATPRREETQDASPGTATIYNIQKAPISTASVSSNMSDYGDDMDVDIDASTARDTVMFNSDNTTKGKRSAANLPVEAEDTLPWFV